MTVEKPPWVEYEIPRAAPVVSLCPKCRTNGVRRVRREWMKGIVTIIDTGVACRDCDYKVVPPNALS